jgi:thiamine biosynthesis lipoprotein
MGTVLEIALVGRDAAELRGALRALFAETRRLEGLLSTWEAASDASRVNATAGSGPLAVAPELSDLLERSAELTRLTRGTFDVTVGPLVSLWADAGTRGELPSPEALAEARSRVGAGRLRVHEDRRVELASDSSLNLSGVAKGFALDRLALLLPEEAVEAALLSFGQSSVLAIGAPPGAAGWRLLARAPGGDFLGVLTLRDRALSVSGSLGSFASIAGRRFGHVLDPRSGAPLEGEATAFVVARDATLAEALSKAVLVLGPEEGIGLVRAQPGCEALRVDAAGRSARTPGFDAAVRFEPLEAPSRPAAQGAPPRVRSR